MGEQKLVGLVRSNLPGPEFRVGEASGEFGSTQNWVERYKSTFAGPFVEKLAATSNLQFVIVMNPTPSAS